MPARDHGRAGSKGRCPNPYPQPGENSNDDSAEYQSDGDIAQLWRSRDDLRMQTPAQMRRFSPGVGGFIDVWFKEQEAVWKSLGLEVRRRDFEPLLNLFALAQGPVTQTDVLALTKRHPILVMWTEDLLDRVLESARRLLIRSDETGGFSLVHPRIGFHYRDALDQSPEELRSLKQVFIDWGKETIDRLNRRELSPAKCPLYLRHHYTWHVLDARLSTERAINCYLLPIVLEPGWHRSWYEAERSYGGFLLDLSRVEDVLPSGLAPYLGKALHCLLCRSRIRAVSCNIPTPLLTQLIDCGLWSMPQALRAIRHLDGLSERVYALVATAAAAVGTNRRRLLEYALDLASTIGNRSRRDASLAQLPQFV